MVRVGTLAPEVEDRWPILRLVVDMGLPLREVEHMDLDDIRQLNAVLDMRRDHDSAADAWQAENVKKSQKERTSGN